MMGKLLGIGMMITTLVQAGEPLRRVSVPQEVLPLLLEQGADRVMMPAGEYERLWRLAEEIKNQTPAGFPEARPPLQVDVTAVLEADHVRVQVTCVLAGMHAGWNMLELPFENLFWTSATFDGQPAQLAGTPGGTTRVFFEGRNSQILQLEGVTGLTLNRNRQHMRFRVPQSPGSVQLQVHQETEISGLTTVASEVKGSHKMLKVLPEGGWVDAAFSLNRLYRPDSRQLSLRLLQTAEVSLSHQEIQVAAQVMVRHQATDLLTFTLPAGLTVQSLKASPAADWDLTPGETRQQLHVRFPKEVLGNVTVEMVVLGEREGLESWSPADIQLVDSHRNWGYQTVHLLDPLRLGDIDYGSATPLPPLSALLTQYPEGTVFAWHPAATGALPQISLRKREGRVEGFASLMLQVGDVGQTLKGEVTLLPKGEGLFSSRFTLPSDWHLDHVRLSTGEDLAYERYAVEGGQQMLRVDFERMAPAQRPVSYRFAASHTPPGWMASAPEKKVTFPSFGLPGVDRLTGALAAEADEGYRLRVLTLEGLTPLDDRTRSLLNFQTGDRVAGYRFETADRVLELVLEALEPELRVEAYSFFTLETTRINLRYEWILENRRASIREFTFTLPVKLPRGVTPRLTGMALQGEVLREPDGMGGERWTVPFTGRPGSRVQMVLESEMAYKAGGGLVLPLPRHAAHILQSGFLAVEGVPELRVTLENAPREVDLGELSEAAYRPGARLLGSYAYTGLPPEVRMIYAPQPLLDAPATRLRRLQLDTRLSITGEAQTQAGFTLEQPSAFLSLRLPSEAVCWGVEVNQMTVEPRKGKQGEWLIPVQGAVGEGTTLVQVIYSSRVPSPGAGKRQQMQAPALSVYAEDRIADALAPVETLWRVSPPEGVSLMNSKGSAMLNRPLRHDLAAVGAAKGLIRFAGGVRSPMEWYNTLFGSFLRRSMKSAKGYEYEERAYDSMADVQDQLYGVEVLEAEELPQSADPFGYTKEAKPSAQIGSAPDASQSLTGGSFGGKMVPPGKPQGYRSLKIRLEPRTDGIRFHSLNPAPMLDISLLRAENLRFAALAVGFLVFAIGVGFCGSRRRARVTYVMGAVLFSTLPGLLPFMSAWTRVFNAVFVAAGGLCLFYVGCWLAGKLWRPFKRPMIVLLAFMMGLGVRSAELSVPPPLPMPAKVVVEVRADDPSENLLLVPRAHLESLRKQVEAQAEMQDPQVESLRWFGGAIRAQLGEDARVDWTGLFRLRTRGDGVHVIPFPVVGAEMEAIQVNGKTARLRSRNGLTEVLIEGSGVHELTFVLRAKVQREASVRFVDFKVSAIPSLVAEVMAPAAGWRMEVSGAQLERTMLSTGPDERLQVPVEQDGRVRVRWYQPANLVEGGGGLQISSLQVMDISWEELRMVDALTLSPGGVPLDRLQVKVPEGWHLNQVDGEVVSGWERGEAGKEDWVTVYFLREVQERAEIRLSLWKKRDAGTEAFAVPAFPVQGAVRQTGTVVLRTADDVVVKVLETENVRRVEMPSGLPVPAAIHGTGVPETFQRFHSYGSHSADYKILLQVAKPENRLHAKWQALLRVAALGDVVEARCRVEMEGSPVYRLQFGIPREMEVTRVECEGVEEWSVDEGHLRMFAPQGLRTVADVVIEGRFPAVEQDRRILPELKLVGSDSRSGEWVVLADPAVQVESVGELEMKRITLAATYAWLSAPQRVYARLALAFSGTDAAPALQLTRLTPEVTVTTFTNIRINHQVIEETLLVDARIRRAGLREFRLRVPARFRDARVKAPLMREVRVVPLPDQPEWVDMTVVLQDEVMDQLVILLEKDRGAESTDLKLQPPMSLTGRTQRVFVTVENAGRDEVRLLSSSGLEALSRGHAEWQSVTGMLGENVTFAFVGAQGGPVVELNVNRIAREQAVTAGGRIGLSRVDLQMDGEGAYLGRWTAWVDNRTEQTLRTVLPAGARLVGVTVAGEEVRVLRNEKEGGNSLRIPLVKTPRGERDIQVEMIYAGTVPSLASLRRDGFPFPESLNLPVDLSQATLYLPKTRRWLRFDGSMRQVANDAQLEAGWLNYQAGLAERLAQTLKTGDVFEQARATYNISQLQSAFEDEDLNQGRENADYAAGRQRAGEALEKAQRELKRAEVNDADPDLSDNRLSFQTLFEGQSNSFSRNEVLLSGSNFEVETGGEVNGERRGKDAQAEQDYKTMNQVLKSENASQGWFFSGASQSETPRDQSKARGGRKQQAVKYLGDLGKSAPAAQAAVPAEALLFPQPDPARTVVYRFTTPRGEMAVTAISVSEQVIHAWTRAGVFLLLLLALVLLSRFGRIQITRPGQTVTLLLFLGFIGLITGFLPVLAIGMIIGGWVLKMQSRKK